MSGKTAWRHELKERVRATSGEDRERWSAAIRSHILASSAWRQVRTVMLFAAMRFEPDLVPLFSSRGDRRLVFPVMENDRIVARLAEREEDLVLSAGGIREPHRDCPEIRPDEIDLVLIPGLGFGRDGTRLGRGKGHYDRFLMSLPLTARRCGVCFACQVSDTLPAEPHDVPVSGIVTEHGSTHEC